MLRISKKGDYAIFLLTCLVQAEREECQPQKPGSQTPGSPKPRTPASKLRSASELSRESGLSRSLVANLLKDLARAGILDSVRGQHGGYQLARQASAISLRQILRVTDGPISLVDCASHTNPHLLADAEPASPVVEGSPLLPLAPQAQSPSCELAPRCPSRAPLLMVHKRILAVLDSVSLEELARPVRLPPIQTLLATPKLSGETANLAPRRAEGLS
ncbi:MAG: hypothetical protein CSA62_11585 [Planctomycetota bacterium]|nr:MAG: hypothetical protein CSA62_11585 [Planctomycetota bacterium]